MGTLSALCISAFALRKRGLLQYRKPVNLAALAALVEKKLRAQYAHRVP